MLASSLDDCIRLWDYVAGSVKKTYQGHQNRRFAVGGCFGVLKDGDRGSGGSEERDAEDDVDEGNRDGDGSRAEHARGGRRRQTAFVASASEDGDVVLWDVTTKEVVQRVRGHDGVCFWVDVHGGLMVSAGQDGVIRVYRHEDDTAVAVAAAVVPAATAPEGPNGGAEVLDSGRGAGEDTEDDEEGTRGSGGAGEDEVMEDLPPIKQEDLKAEET